MNFIDKVIRAVSPVTAAKRARARAALRVYEAAEPGRRANAWRGRNLSQNSEAQRALAPLRERSRDFARNSAWGPRLLDILSGYVIGGGWRPVPRTGSDRLDTKVVKLWEEWNKEADVEGLLSFDAQQALAFRSVVESGDMVIRFIDQKRGKNRGSKIPMKIQLLESDFIDHTRDGAYAEVSGAGNGTRRSRLGVGLGEFDFRTGLWLYPYHPGEMVTPSINNTVSQFFARDELAHMFRMVRPGQVRGVSWFAPLLTMGRDLSDFLDALIVKARVEACFTGFVTQNNFEEYEQPFAENVNGLVSNDNPDALITTMEPGMLRELKPGQDIKFAQATTTSQVDPMLKFPLMAMAAAGGITYEQLSGDLSGSNYISLRAGKLDFRRLVEQTQGTMVLPMLMNRVWDRFIDRAIMVGELNERVSGYKADWVTPAWESVNPKFDNDAEERSVRSGRQSPQEFVESFGRDWRKVQDDAKEFFERADKMGLVFDIDTRRVSRGGQMHPPEQGGKGQPPLEGVAAEAPEFDENGNPLPDEQVEAFEDQLQAANDRVLPFPNVRRAPPLMPPKKPRKRSRARKSEKEIADQIALLEEARGLPFSASKKAEAIAFLRARRDFDWNEEDHPRDDDGKFTSGGGGGGGGGGKTAPSSSAAETVKFVNTKTDAKEQSVTDTGYEFVSPNVETGLKFDGAVEALDSEQQASLHEASAFINKELGLNAFEADIIGAWSDGAENSIMDVVPGADWDTLILSAAMKGALADQKSVLVFKQSDDEGGAALYRFHEEGSLADIHDRLLKAGIENHTLIPTDVGADVIVVDTNLSLHDKIEGVASGQVTYEFGKADFVGTRKQDGDDREQRDDAQRTYAEIIGQSKVQGAAEIWQRVRDRWGKADEVKSPPITDPGDIKGTVDQEATDEANAAEDERVQAIMSAAREEATARGYDAEKIKAWFSDKVDIKMLAGGVSARPSAEFVLANGNIRINVNEPLNTPETIKGVVAHEVQHAKWFSLMRAYSAAGDGSDLVKTVNKLILNQELPRTDGVTDYSRLHWENVPKDGSNIDPRDAQLAINETLSEIARMEQSGVDIRETVAKGWLKLYDFVNKRWDDNR